MIDKKLVHFNENSTFENNKDQIKDTSIVFVKDVNKIYTHGADYQFVGWSYLTVDVPEGYEMCYFRDGAFMVQDGYFLLKKE